MYKSKMRQLFIIGPLLFISLLWIMILGACKEEVEEPEKRPVQAAEKTGPMTESMFVDIFGKAGLENSGLYSLETEGEEFVLTYHFIYEEEEVENLDAQIGEELMPMIEKFFDTYEHVKSLGFMIYTSPLGEGADLKPYVSFIVNHKTFDEVEWASFPAADLFKIAENLTYQE